MKQFMSKHRMIHQTSCLDTLKQNGVAECKNRTLLEITRALLIESHSPAYFWPETIARATYRTNRVPSKPLRLKLLLKPWVPLFLFLLFTPYLIAYLGVLFLYIFQNKIELNLKHGQLNVFFLAMG